MTDHTPTPWTPDKYGQLRGANGVPVNTKALGLSQSLGGGANPEAVSNSALILTAVNAHDDLLTALRNVVKANDEFHNALAGVPGDQSDHDAFVAAQRAETEAIEAARAVIAKVEAT